MHSRRQLGDCGGGGGGQDFEDGAVFDRGSRRDGRPAAIAAGDADFRESEAMPES